jgi:hypothetical protein
MEGSIRIQGRDLSAGEIDYIRGLIASHPDWSRRRLSQRLCQAWDWRNGSGVLKDMAARSLLLKLEQRGLVQLPERRQAPTNRMRIERDIVDEAPIDTTPITATLSRLQPLRLELVEQAAQRRVLHTALSHHHYLGFGGTVGESLAYLAYDRRGRLLACLVFGAAAWALAARDRFVGWERSVRERRLHLVANNNRFLILPWVRVTHLASHLLAAVARHISADAMHRYGHPLYLLESFVEQERFAGTCYRAANWQVVGTTQGRSRNDRHRSTRVPVKAVLVYPLRADFRQRLREP